MPFYRWDDILKDVQPGPTLPAGMSRRGLVLGDILLGMHEALPGLKPPAHTHSSGQIALMLNGRLRMKIAGEERIISPGELAWVPPGVEHSIESLDEYVRVLDIFRPVRQDILTRLRELEG
jgi:mannose-6-phosphate isomerase-like protein (cupin superfamily)